MIDISVCIVILLRDNLTLHFIGAIPVVDKFKGRQAHRMVEVMCGIAEHENCKSMASRLDLLLHMIHFYRRNAHKELRKVYRCPA